MHPEQRGIVVRACPLLGVIILSGCTNVSFIAKRCLICAHIGGVLNCLLVRAVFLSLDCHCTVILHANAVKGSIK